MNQLTETWEERFYQKFTYGGITGRAALKPTNEDPRPFMDFIASELALQKQALVREVRQAAEFWFSTHDRTSKSFESDDFIKFITEEL